MNSCQRGFIGEIAFQLGKDQPLGQAGFLAVNFARIALPKQVKVQKIRLINEILPKQIFSEIPLWKSSPLVYSFSC